MKKILSIMACMVMVLVGGIALASCGSMTNDYISAPMGDIALGGQNFSNSQSFKVEYKGDNKYEATGDVSTMSAEQADAFWKDTAQAGDKYVVVSIKFNVGSKVVFGFEQDGADFTNPDGVKVKTLTNSETENDTLDIVLRLTDSGNTSFKVVVTEKDMNAETFTVDMSKVI